jgi:hypothetical protein
MECAGNANGGPDCSSDSRCTIWILFVFVLLLVTCDSALSLFVVRNSRYWNLGSRLHNCPEFEFGETMGETSGEMGETAQKPNRTVGNGCGRRYAPSEDLSAAPASTIQQGTYR